MTYRLEVDFAFNVRARKGERREKGTGRLIKCLIYRGAREECFADARLSETNLDSAEVVDVRGYDEAVYKVDPLKAVPNFKSAELI